MEQMCRLPIGIQTFEEIRKENYLYMDKTAMVYQLVNIGKPHFLSRSCRSGKSLLISIFEAYFQSRKDLFEGLAIEKLETEWEEYPVFRLDLNAEKYDNKEALKQVLSRNLSLWEDRWRKGAAEDILASRFAGVLRRTYEQTDKRAVVSTGEYDKPLLQATPDEPLLEEYRRVLKAFYGVLKSTDRYLRFVFLTGVTKFAQVSMFSDLNQLNDISMDYAYSSLCGVTKEELSSNFVPGIKNLGEFLGLTFEEIVDRPEKQYDGYHFCEDTTVGPFSPFSVLSALQKLELGNYWFQTGAPTYLVGLLKQSGYDLRLLISGIETTNSAFSEYRAETNNPLSMIYQSGYLTIKHYDKEVDLYTLKFPNGEACRGFLNFLIPYYIDISDDETSFHITKFIREFRSGDIEAFMERLRVFFAGMPYELSENIERHYQTISYVIFTLMGQFVGTEVRSVRGRADAVVKTKDFIFVFEFKLNGTAEKALKQVDEKGYLIPYTLDGRKLVRVRVNFSKKKRNIDCHVIG